MRDVEVATYVGQNDVLVAPDTLHARRRWGAESDALELAADVLGRFDDPVLVDVGAAAGEWSLLAVVVENLRVFAFEPHTGFASLLRENLQLNGVYGQTSVYAIALGAEPGTATLKVPGDAAKWGLSTTAPRSGFESAETREVCVATLDQFFTLQDPTLVKVDAEGGELGVLRGAERTVKRYEPAFVLEVCQKRTEQFGYDADKIGDVMAAYGYNEAQLSNDNRYYWKREGHRP